MKSYLKACLIFIVLTAVSCSGRGKGDIPASVIDNPATASGKASGGDLPVIEFKTDLHDFGKVYEGETVSYGFVFKNVGKRDLVISNVATSCGCTVTDYPKDDIKAGVEKIINVSFKTEGKRGFQQKTITVTTNTIPNNKVLTIKAMVLPGAQTE
ncbi:MAG: DUF1573 domain-containing protein [Bacteroidota bacterium]